MKSIKSVLNESNWKSASQPPAEKSHQLCRPDCDICHGVGYVREDVPLGHSNFGKMIPCPNMDMDISMPGYARKYGLNQRERTYTWNDLFPVGESNIMEIAAKVQSIQSRGYGWIYLWGDFGIGKTLMLQIVAAMGLKGGRESAYIRMADIMDMLREGYSKDDYAERLEWLRTIPILCIDEFERVNERNSNGLSWVGEKRFILMDSRYISAIRGESLTVMAGNINPAQFTFDDGYLRDRIEDNRFNVFRITGDSLRPGMEWNL